MRLLFEIDKKDYVIGGSVFSRPSARGIIIKNGKIAMVHSRKYDYYKFPGGGIEGNERKEDDAYSWTSHKKSPQFYCIGNFTML